MTLQQRTEARIALQPLLGKAAALRIRHAAPPDAAARRVAAAAAEVVSVLEKHISQLQDAE